MTWSGVALRADSEEDAALVRDLEDNLIATCCWTQPISQHESPTSDQMKAEVRAMVAAGKTREEILDHFVALHGEKVLAVPRQVGFNRLMYILPGIALVFGTWFVVVRLRGLRAPAAESSSKTTPAPDTRYASVIEKELKDLEEK
jgi:cytochrome c-type biogenesis protein CcmH